MLHTIRLYLPVKKSDDVRTLCNYLHISDSSLSAYLYNADTAVDFRLKLKQFNAVLADRRIISNFYFGIEAATKKFIVRLSLDLQALFDGFKSTTLYSSSNYSFNMLTRQFYLYTAEYLELPLFLCDFCRYQLSYVEFAANIVVPAIHSDLFALMLQKTAMPYNGFIIDSVGEKGAKTIYIRSKSNDKDHNKGKFLKIYNKSEAVKQKQTYVTDNITTADTILYRYEVIYTRDEIRKLELQHSTEEILSDTFSANILREYAERFFCGGTYYTANILDTRIKKAIKKAANTSGKVIDTRIKKAIQLRKKVTLHKALKKIKMLPSEKDLQKTLSANNICIVPIPREHSKNINDNCMTNYLSISI